MTEGSARGEAELAFICVIILLACGFFGFLITDAINRASCDDYGKVRLLSKVYDCKPEPKK